MWATVQAAPSPLSEPNLSLGSEKNKSRICFFFFTLYHHLFPQQLIRFDSPLKNINSLKPNEIIGKFDRTYFCTR